MADTWKCVEGWANEPPPYIIERGPSQTLVEKALAELDVPEVEFPEVEFPEVAEDPFAFVEDAYLVRQFSGPPFGIVKLRSRGKYITPDGNLGFDVVGVFPLSPLTDDSEAGEGWLDCAYWIVDAHQPFTVEVTQEPEPIWEFTHTPDEDS